MTLSPVATEKHVDEAVRLFNISTLHAIQSGNSGEGGLNPIFIQEVEKIQNYILKRVGRGVEISYNGLKNSLERQVPITINSLQLIQLQDYNAAAIDRAIFNLVQKQILSYKDRRMSLCRIG